MMISIAIAFSSMTENNPNRTWENRWLNIYGTGQMRSWFVTHTGSLTWAVCVCTICKSQYIDFSSFYAVNPFNTLHSACHQLAPENCSCTITTQKKKHFDRCGSMTFCNDLIPHWLSLLHKSEAFPLSTIKNSLTGCVPSSDLQSSPHRSDRTELVNYSSTMFFFLSWFHLPSPTRCRGEWMRADWRSTFWNEQSHGDSGQLDKLTGRHPVNQGVNYTGKGPHSSPLSSCKETYKIKWLLSKWPPSSQSFKMALKQVNESFKMFTSVGILLCSYLYDRNVLLKQSSVHMN